MRYAIISDIHANLEALTTVVSWCKDEGISQYVCAGDIVGYNANPKECLDIVRGLDLIACVRGNHDEYVAKEEEELVGFNPHAKAAVLWTKNQLSAEDRAWLGELPLKKMIRQQNMTVVHATLDSPEAWGYIFDIHHAVDNFSYQFTQFSFCGHSHVPVAFIRKPIAVGGEKQVEELPEWKFNPSSPDAPKVIELKPGAKYLFNIGSVGQPRNSDPRASFAVVDTDTNQVRRICLHYDIELAQDKIRRAGLPERLASRLARGT